MQVKNWKTEIVKMSDVILNDDNSRIIDPAALQGLQASIERFGLVELIIWNRMTKHIVGGHQRYAVLVSKGITEAQMIVVEMSMEDESAASMTLNNPKIEGEFDYTAIELLDQVDANDSELFKSLRMDSLKEQLERTMLKPSDVIPDEKQKYDTKCPCCGNKWKVDVKDIVMVKGET